MGWQKMRKHMEVRLRGNFGFGAHSSGNDVTKLRDERCNLCGFWHRGLWVRCTNVGCKFLFTLGFVIHFHFIQ